MEAVLILVIVEHGFGEVTEVGESLTIKVS